MMKTIKRGLICAMLVSSLAAYPVPARRGIRVLVQPDGTKIEARLVGDEFSHCFISTANRPLVKTGDTYYFASAGSDGRLVPTSVKACPELSLTAAQRASLDAMSNREAAERHLKAGKARRLARRNASGKGLGLSDTSFPSKGAANSLIILVQYKDVKFKLDSPYDYFNSMINQEGFSQYGGTGSVSDYFKEASCGVFQPNFEVYGPVTLSQNMSYYGGNNAYGDDSHPEEMVSESCRQLDSKIDFSKFDNDGDGYVDNVYVIYAGQGEASYGSEDSVWPHSWNLSEAGIDLRLDGVRIDLYGCSNEWEEERPDGVGTFIHEFSHILGLPDLYDTSGDYYSQNAYDTPGAWSVLDYGPYNNDGRTPPMYSVYERNALGWCEPELITEAMDCRLENFASSNKAYMAATSKDREFFLFENRQQTGWDKYLPGHGMLIWHVEALQSVFDDNTVNNTEGHHYVDIVEANGKRDNEDDAVMAGYSFPGTAGVTSFTSSTKPAFKEWSGKAIELPITDIAENGGIITFKVDGGEGALAAPEAAQPSDVSAKGFTASWSAVENATDYLLTVQKLTEGVPVESKCDFGSGNGISLPEGWASSSKESYGSNSKGYFGTSAPALKLGKEKNVEEHFVSTPVFDNDITSLSYWQRGASTKGESTVHVMGLKDGSWTEIESYPTSDTEDTHTVSDIPQGVRQIKIVYEKKTGNLALDDIVVVSGGSAYVAMPGYDAVSTGGNTSFFVSAEGIAPCTLRYYVCASGAEGVSRQSNMVVVRIDENGVSIAGTENTGIRIYGRRLSAAGRIELYGIDGTMISAADGELEVPAAGLYIVKASGKVFKAMVK